MATPMNSSAILTWGSEPAHIRQPLALSGTFQQEAGPSGLGAPRVSSCSSSDIMITLTTFRLVLPSPVSSRSVIASLDKVFTHDLCRCEHGVGSDDTLAQSALVLGPGDEPGRMVNGHTQCVAATVFSRRPNPACRHRSEIDRRLRHISGLAFLLPM